MNEYMQDGFVDIGFYEKFYNCMSIVLFVPTPFFDYIKKKEKIRQYYVSPE